MSTESGVWVCGLWGVAGLSESDTQSHWLSHSKGWKISPRHGSRAEVQDSRQNTITVYFPTYHFPRVSEVSCMFQTTAHTNVCYQCLTPLQLSFISWAHLPESTYTLWYQLLSYVQPIKASSIKVRNSIISLRGQMNCNDLQYVCSGDFAFDQTI